MQIIGHRCVVCLVGFEGVFIICVSRAGNTCQITANLRPSAADNEAAPMPVQPCYLFCRHLLSPPLLTFLPLFVSLAPLFALVDALFFFLSLISSLINLSIIFF